MTDNSFSLGDLYPKYVINSKGEKKEFEVSSIAKVLNKETGLDINIAEKVTEEVVRKIIGLGIDEISTNYIRELVCVELTQRGLNKYRNLFARAINLESISFTLDEAFINEFKGKQPEWGPLGQITYKRTYARFIEKEGRKEDFWETIRRVVEGCYSIQKEHCMKLSLPWSDTKAQRSAQIMYQKIWNFKFLPPGRGLWMMGTEFIARHGSMSLNNCGFASTEDIDLKYSKAFEFVMDALMLGVGVGFDTKGAGKITIKKPHEGAIAFEIPDSREGWVEALRIVLEAYFLGKQRPIFDYALIRSAGEPIRGFGGIASGPAPLKDMLESIQDILEVRINKDITSLDILDIMNLIGKCVVAGNVRRCLPEGTLIHTKKGLIPIEKLKPGMLIETTKGHHPILEVIHQGRQNLVKIHSQIGEFQCTKNHQIAVMTNIGQYTWKKAMELNSGDRIVFPIHISKGTQTNLPEWSYDEPAHSTTCKDIIIPPLDEDLAWFLGYFHGDGCVIPNFKKNGFNAEINVAIDKNHTLIVKKCREQLLRFGVNIYSPELEEGCVKLRCISKQLAWYFDHFKQAKTSIVIPDYIMEGKSEIRAAYLAGLFDADGSSLTRPIHLVASIYPKFLHQVKALYASLGIPTRIKKTDRSNIENWNDIFNINLVGEVAIKRFMNILQKYSLKFTFTRKTMRSQNDFGYPAEWILENNFDYGRKWTPSQKQMTVATYTKCGGKINNLIPIEVYNVINNDSKKYNTFDISIANVHELIAADGILVHNSAEIALGEATDLDFITSKQDEEKLYSHRWASNNSVFAVKGLDYSFIADQIAVNGEPGIFWLDNAKAYSRMGDAPDFKDKKAAGVNPCGEQTLESFELCCATGDTRIQTKNGAPRIADVVDKEVEVWNGDCWSKVKPFLAAKDKEIFRVLISDGSYLDCTSDHNWHIRPSTARVFRSVETKDLKLGDYVVPFDIDKIFGGIYEPNAFEYGLFSGDGYIDRNYPMVSICGEKSKLKELDVKGTWYKEQIKEGYNEPYNRLNLKDVIDLKLAEHLNDKSRGLPDLIFSWDQESILEFTAGLIETDGNLCHQVNTDNYRIFGNEEKIRDLQILLRRIGINHSTIYSAGDAGEETNFRIRNYTIYCLYIPSYECGEIPTRIKKAMRIGPRYAINNRHPDGKMIDRARKQKITKVEKLKELQLVYCFNEPINHMGIFGNVLTYQCLVETFPSRHDSYEEFQETLKFAYLYSKSVTLVNTHWQETNAVMLKNRRMGVSQTGIIEAFVKNGRRTVLEWCKKGYDYLQSLDEQYSGWLCIPRSIKITTVKPSGTVSLLPGVPPGIHYPHSEYYIRRIRISKNSDLIEPIRKAGYFIEDDSYSPNTIVVEFPVHEQHFERSKNDVSIWEQAENAADYQKYWSDNQVSITITFQPHEANQIKHVLECFEDKLKSVSFLPIKEHGYKQAPYEEITQEKYEEMTSKLTPIFLDETKDRAIGEKFCDSDSCELPLDYFNK